MREYAHRLKHYTREDLEGKELYLINSRPWSKRILVEKLKVSKVTDKTIVLVGGGRIPVAEAGLNKQYSRLVCPKEDIEEIVKLYKESMVKMYQKEISNLEEQIEEFKDCKIQIKGEI